MKTASRTLAIRRMTEDDVEWAQSLAEGSLQAPHWPTSAYVSAANPKSEPKRVALVAEIKNVPNALVAKIRNVPAFGGRTWGRIAVEIGFVVARLVLPQAELETIVIFPASRGHGVGAALMRAMIEQLKSAGATEVTLEVRCSNRPALALYRSVGFIEAGRRTGYYFDPIEDAVLMRLELG
jgi:[ribosomal protein S18]-alanine N-acetyltransferase